MKLRDYAAAKSKLNDQEALYLKAWEKDRKNLKLKERYFQITEVHAAFDQVYGLMKYYRDAVKEREHSIGILEKEAKERAKEREVSDFMKQELIDGLHARIADLNATIQKLMTQDENKFED